MFRIRHGSLLLRSYLMIVGGLVAIAAVLDYGLQRLQQPDSVAPSVWVEGTLDLIEAQLAERSAVNRSAAVAALEHQFGLPIRLIPADQVAGTGATGRGTQEVFDKDGRSAFIRHSETLGSMIQIGPAPEARRPEGWLIRLVTPVFYLSVFLLVGLWLWPLVRDLNVLTESAAAFAADYRRPVHAQDRVSSLRELAGSFDEMSTRISTLVQHQKEWTDALSHEVRTPLARIKFALAVIGDDTTASEELQSIRLDVAEIEGLINTMLDYARLDRFDLSFEPQLTPVDPWLEQIVTKFRLQNPTLRIEQQRTTEQVMIDPGLMELALSNLLVNACRYAKSRVLAKFEHDANGCRLAVEDDGTGIPEAERTNVFKAYSRLDTSRNRQTGGYGLGLAIVARVANLHGGTAHAERSGLGGARLVISWGGL